MCYACGAKDVVALIVCPFSNFAVVSSSDVRNHEQKR
jgi:hypothetical protein